jgi:hypothetical protein
MTHGIKGSVNRCPVIDAFEMRTYMDVFRYWQSGQYPNPGTWADQPNRLVKIMECIDGTLADSG